MSREIRIAGTEVSFSCAEGQTILDAALQAGIEMPYSCRQGVCGNCAGTVASGVVRCPDSDVAPAGLRLFCLCVAESDLEIVPAAWHRVDPAARKIFTVKVYRNTLAAPDVSLLQLRLPAGQRAKFKAGQYLQIALPDGSRRSYSMANPPHENDTLQLHVRHVGQGTFSRIVPTLATGTTLQVELPFGSFELREGSSAPMVCVAGGTGFAPIKSLIDDLQKKAIRRSITLLWGARDGAGLYLMSAVERWKKLMPDFRFQAAIENAADAQALGAIQGRVDEAVRREFASLAGHEVYCCGAPAMVTAVKQACIEDLSLPPSHFHADVFVAGPAAPSPSTKGP